MPKKSFSIYSSDFEAEDGDRLVVEIAKTHFACLVSKKNKRAISACELFTFNEAESKNFEELFGGFLRESKILHTRTPSAEIFINNEFCLPVPIFKFNKEIAADYLNLVFGDNSFSKIQFEHLPIEPGIMNVYRVDDDLFQSLHTHFPKMNFHHTYSNIIRHLAGNAVALHAQQINVQFYNTFIIAVVMKGANLQLIQTFVYETPEDVLYYLLNIAKQFELYSADLVVQISGMIDLDFKLYRELITCFKEVRVESVNEASLSLHASEYPLHYFTPFFNLAL